MTRQRLYAILEGEDPEYGTRYAIFANVVIVIAILGYAIGTMPDLTPRTQQILLWVEAFVIAVFAADYFARLATAPSAWRYATSFWGIVDLIAFLPALILAGTNLSSARALRMIQLARILKLLHLTHALDQMSGAIRSVRDQLAVFLILTLIVLYLAAVGIYIFEHEAQPDVFASVPHAMWWAVATLSTVGYGDIYPITPGGKFFTSIVLVIGLAVIAVPTGLISAALVSRAEHREESPTEKEEDDT